ncbi:hypothetical protein C8R48DRAFT_745992 [Suillus tomentosus]|nr:hypothetical protein C8R48DRAFT_745992 [Suillus tomentosus]
MLYCFREAQAAELDLGTRADRRPKMVSACKSLREELSSKVSKIQDDANYRRNVVILDDDGKGVSGTTGHKYAKFMNQGPACFSDLDEADRKLLEHERQAEGKEWRDEYSNVREILDFPLDDPTPKIPRGSSLSSSPLPSDGLSPPQRLLNTKCKAQEEDMSSSREGAGSMRAYANTAADYLGFWSPEDLMPLTLPTREEMEDVLLALLEEYLGE